MEKVTITKKEYNQLKDDSLKLSALEQAGVDNWSGYEFAIDQYNEWLEEDE